MSTEFFNDQWRVPSNENQNKISNYSMEFDGTSSLVDISGISSSLSSSGAGSVSGWLKWDGTSVMRPFTFSSNSVDRQYIIILVLSNGKAYAQLKDSWQLITSSAVFTANVWTHFVVTHNGTAPKFYINGSVPPQGFTQITNKTHWWSHLNTLNTVNIGAMTWSNGNNNPTINYGAGVIDQVAIFDYSLLATEVSTLYGDGTAVVNPMTLSPKPIHYAQLGDQSVYNGANYLVPNNSLSGSEGYSPYALDFDGATNKLNLSSIDSTGNKTYSCWIYPTVSGNNGGILTLINSNSDTDFISIALWESEIHALVAVSPTSNNRKNTVQTISANQWYHIAVVKSTGSIDNIYINGANQTLTGSGGWNAASVTSQNQIANADFGSSFGFAGNISNVATWDVALTSTEITEVYNQGVPSNLHTFSGTAPTSWWQMGSNSSFNSSTWTCLDEIGTNNAVSGANMSNDDIVNGVGYSGNGLGTSSIDIVGDAPYSSANGLSEGMDVLDRSTDVPS